MIISPATDTSLMRGLVKRNGRSRHKTTLKRCSRKGLSRKMIAPGTKYRILLSKLVRRPRKWKYHAMVGGITQREETIPTGVNNILGSKSHGPLTRIKLKRQMVVNKSRDTKFPGTSIRVNLFRYLGNIVGKTFFEMIIPKQKMDQNTPK